MTGKRPPTLILPRFLLTRHVGSIIRDLFFLRPRKWQTTPILVKISSPQLSREKRLPTPSFWPSVTQVPLEQVNSIAIQINGTSYFNRLITISLKYWTGFITLSTLTSFFTHYKGSYKGVNYNCERPPARSFANHPSCKAFPQFISDTLIERLTSGAISLWGKVGECPPPHLVMPLTVEPTKPCLCNDDRFLNLWTQDPPFKLDSVQHLPKYVLPGFFQTVCDDKSGYDHIQLSVDSRTFFGSEWGGWFFVSCQLFHLVGNRPPTFITPLASLPLIIYGRLAFHLRCTSTTVTIVSFLSLMVVFRLLIKTCPPRIALIWL